jgi:hypothetical protein
MPNEAKALEIEKEVRARGRYRAVGPLFGFDSRARRIRARHKEKAPGWWLVIFERA